MQNCAFHVGNFDDLASIPAMIGTVVVFLCFILLIDYTKNAKWRRHLAKLMRDLLLINDSWRFHNLERAHEWCSAVGKVAF